MPKVKEIIEQHLLLPTTSPKTDKIIAYQVKRALVGSIKNEVNPDSRSKMNDKKEILVTLKC